MGNLLSSIYPGQQPSEKMADGSKKASGLGVKPGALIEISRKHGLYKEWALCVAENEVIHIDLQSLTKTIIKQEKLENVVGSDQWCVNNCLDEIYDAMEVQLAMKEAPKWEDTEIPYNPVANNREHMVTNGRDGEPESRQAQMAVGCMVGVWSLVVLLFIVRRIVLHWKKKEGRQRSSTGPMEEGGEMVSEVEANPPHTELLSMGCSSSTTESDEEWEETRFPGYRPFPVMDSLSSTAASPEKWEETFLSMGSRSSPTESEEEREETIKPVQSAGTGY